MRMLTCWWLCPLVQGHSRSLHPPAQRVYWVDVEPGAALRVRACGAEGRSSPPTCWFQRPVPALLPKCPSSAWSHQLLSHRGQASSQSRVGLTPVPAGESGLGSWHLLQDGLDLTPLLTPAACSSGPPEPLWIVRGGLALGRAPAGAVPATAELPFTECHPAVIDADGTVTEAGHDERAMGITGQARHAAVGTRGDVLGSDTWDRVACCSGASGVDLGPPDSQLGPGHTSIALAVGLAWPGLPPSPRAEEPGRADGAAASSS